MKYSSLLRILLIISALFVSSAHAVIIEGNFWGVAQASPVGEEVPSDNVEVIAEGTKVSGFFWYDTEKAKPYQYGVPVNDNFLRSDTDEWMGSGFSVNGKTYNLSDGVPDSYAPTASIWEYLYLVSLNPSVDGSSREWFNLADVFFEPETNVTSLMSIQLRSEEEPLLNGLDIIQNFDWYDHGDPLSQGFADLSSSTFVDGILTGATASINIKEFHIGIKNSAEVPEPSSIILLAFGLFTIVVRNKARKNRIQH